MRAFALTLTILSLAISAHGVLDYQLKCSHDEVGIRWPSYHSNSDYYMCTRIGGKQIKMSCNAGELFTFVLQACTSPANFIPPPPMNILPTNSLNPVPSKVEQTGIQMPSNVVALPKPLHPADNHPLIVLAPPHPPVLSEDNAKPPNLESSAFEPPHESYSGEQEEISEDKEEAAPVVKPAPPNKLKPVPMPPTPEPTPPVVKKPQSIGKKPPTVVKKQPAKAPKKPASVARKPPKKPSQS